MTNYFHYLLCHVHESFSNYDWLFSIYDIDTIIKIIIIIQGIDALSHENPRYITSPSLTFKHGETIVKCITLYFRMI